ncbi:MAG: oligosaccharide flippase family protein [Candidatus Altiarchaeia archaeon]
MINFNEIKNARKFILQITKGSIILSIGTIGFSLCQFIFKYLLIHSWSPEEYGVFSIIITIVGILGILTEFNLNATTTIFFSESLKTPENKKIIPSVFVSFFLLVLFFLCLSSMVYLVTPKSLVLEVFTGYFFPIWFLVIATGTASISYGIVRAYKKMNYEAISKTIAGLATLFLFYGILISSIKCDVLHAIIILIITQIVAFLSVFALLHRRLLKNQSYTIAKRMLGYTGRLQSSDLRGVLTFSFYMSSISMLSTLLISVDKLIMPYFLPAQIVGLYGGAYFIVSIPKMITGSVGVTLQSFIPERKEKGIENTKREYLALLAAFSMIAALGYCVCICLSQSALVFLPKEYAGIAPIVQTLLIAMLFSDIFLLNISFVSSLKKEKILIKSMGLFGAVLILDIFLNYLLIPKYEMEGAALSTVLSFALLGIISTIQVMKLRE